jgi:acyl carrier protein
VTVQREHISAAVYDCVADMFGIADRSRIGDALSAAEVDGWDSLSHTLLLMRIEDALGWELPLEAVYGAATLGELIDVLDAHAPATA